MRVTCLLLLLRIVKHVRVCQLHGLSPKLEAVRLRSGGEGGS